jgi:hypothetical protein
VFRSQDGTVEPGGKHHGIIKKVVTVKKVKEHSKSRVEQKEEFAKADEKK